MPSDDLLRRLEALNGGPLSEPPPVIAATPQLASGPSIVSVAVSEPRPGKRRSQPRSGAKTHLSLTDAVEGEERRISDELRYFHMERLLQDCADWCSELGQGICAALPGVRSGRTRRGLSQPKPHEVLFFDVETMGLDTQSAIFLFGLLAIDENGRAYCRQLLARTLEEERAALTVAAEALAESKLLVSFNGRSFDLPLLRNRSDHFGLSVQEPPAHVDILLEARKRYSRKLANCRLQTLEERVCGRTREDDVPSKRIPGVYRQWMKTGDATQLQKVIHHNLLDLATTAELFTLFFG